MTTSGVEVNMDNTDKLVDLLIGLKREICEKYYGVNGCYQVDYHGKLHWCPMAYYGRTGRIDAVCPDFCQINDIINFVTESDGTLDG